MQISYTSKTTICCATALLLAGTSKAQVPDPEPGCEMMPNGMCKPAMISSWSPISNFSTKIEDMKLPWTEYVENKTGDLFSYMPVMHGGGGGHYVNILVGSQKHRQPVNIGVNTATTNFPCTGHNSKGFGKTTDPEFNPTLSTTHYALTCAADCPTTKKLKWEAGTYSWRKREKCETLLPEVRDDPPFYRKENHTIYGDRCVFGDEMSPVHGWDAYAMRDQIWSSAESKKAKSAEVKMGCWYQNQGAYNETGMGNLGLSRGNSDLLNNLHDNGMIKTKAFTTCFSEKGGYMSLGTDTSKAAQPDINWVPAMYSSSHWWKVEVTGVRVGETKVAGKMSAWQEGKGTLVDTSNTDTFIPAKLAPQFKEAFEKATGVEYIEHFGLGQGYAMTEAQVAAMPSLYFDLNGGDERTGGATIEVKASAYLAKNEYKDGKYTWRLLLHAEDPAGGVIGANSLRNHRVIFDDENSRIGFEGKDCDAEAKKQRNAMKRNNGDNLRSSVGSSSISTSSTKQVTSPFSNIMYVGVGWLLASVSILIGFQANRLSTSSAPKGVHTAVALREEASVNMI